VFNDKFPTDLQGPSDSDCTTIIRMALSDPVAAETAFPGYRLTRLVTTRLEMGEQELRVFRDLSGELDEETQAGDPALFEQHLRVIIPKYDLFAFFQEDGPARFHHAFRPTGYDYFLDQVDPQGMEKWRADYRDMSTQCQMLAASIIWLYRGRKDNVWLRRVPSTWHAAEAIHVMQSGGVLEDWARLMFLYPGW
jgi:hypothetical protein